uniref:26S proteasome non-ATPase regulatory subunit 1 n=1 Tax=Romanomermis culicivorax TaxID=13658 RepID=A0A915J501_ROMCU
MILVLGMIASDVDNPRPVRRPKYLFGQPFIGKLQHGGRFVKFDALKNLNKCVGYLWHEIAGDVMKIEALAADNGYEHSDLAALVASKVYFNSQLQDEALEFALKAGDAFYSDAYFVAEFDDIYRESIQNKVLDTYTVLQQRNVLASDPKDRKPIDGRLTRLVERLWEQSRQCENHREAIAYVIESRRVDKLKELLESVSPAQQSSLLSYCLRNTLEFEKFRKYRNELLQCLIEIYSKLQRPDYINVCQCLIFLDQPEGVATVLEKLVRESKKEPKSFFDKCEQEKQCVCLIRLSRLYRNLAAATQRLVFDFGGNAMEEKLFINFRAPEGDLKTRLNSLIKILSGDETVSLHMQFLIKNNKTDMLILKSMKDVVKSNVTHSATIISNGLMHAGTTCDDFLRDNLEWVGKASNWAKFTTVASLGVIHKGHENEANKILEPYLPKDSATATSGYVEGGGLYAYGLIHANHGNDKVIDYLKAQLNKQVGNDNNAAIIIKHGACLGLGLAAMGTHKQGTDTNVYDVLRSNLYTDDAVVGKQLLSE